MILQVIAKIPNTDRERFVGLLRGSPTGDKRDQISEDFQEDHF